MDNLQDAYLNVYNDIDEAAKRMPPKERGAKDPVAYMKGRSDAGKRISGDQDTGPRHYTLGRARGANVDAPTQPGQRPVGTPKLASWEKDDIKYRQANLKAGKVHKVGGERGIPEERDYNELLKFLYFEGYAESYAEAEELLESLSDEEFHEILEAYKEPDLAKMKKQEERHRTAAVKQRGGSRGSSKNRAFKMSSIRGALERGEDPRADTYGGAQKKPVDHRADYSKNPLNNPPRPVKKPGVNESVVEYLFVEGYADTIEKAEVMAENISENWAIEILEAAKDQTDKQIDKGVKTTYKAGNVLDNQHQGRSSGLNRLSGTEREAKEKRMRGRLKSRRDDLFDERNKREDAKREALKKMLGL